ncbi:Flavin-dependent thymidylate synthase [Paenibacillus solanacearum]|uniref:Flavin-dependent thymidylate synthase n=1 Tax=Paenibacillus solanacearum TaxID=2048548 RepID=A0A916NY31_9BACL|nr:Flavin-dependent thymidylate synthase [Paenibacillus solanacearum]
MSSFIKVLNEGYVRLVDHMGSDLTVANAARVSYAKQSLELTERDVKLIKFLAREGHTSPFRHAIAQFEVYAPLMVARQWLYAA